MFDSKFLRMDGKSKRFVRFHNNAVANMDPYSKYPFEVDSTQTQSFISKKEPGKGSTKVHSEGYESDRSNVLDPRDRFLLWWNRVRVFICLAALFIDPIFYYLPIENVANTCFEIDKKLQVVVTILRSITDFFYLAHIAIQFRTGYIIASSRVLGRGELVTDPLLIAKRYLRKRFIVDLFAVLPLPQIIIWGIIPVLRNGAARNAKFALWLIVLFQLIPRLYPLTQRLGKSSGLVTETAWSGAAYNLLLYILISHFFGACWYLLTVERQETCWIKTTGNTISKGYLDCSSLNDPNRSQMIGLVNSTACQPDDDFFNFGIYVNALSYNILSMEDFVKKYLYCFWWGLQNLSTVGQGLTTSSFVGEVIFSIIISVVGLTLFARLIGNMQTYLQSLTVRLEEMRLKRQDMEQWMQHRQLPKELRERVHSYEQYKWLETRGVKEKELVESLPKDLRRDIKRHLCLELVKGVPLFSNMDDRLLDAICERLQSLIFTKGTNVVQEGDPVNEMLFIIRGQLKSETTNGGKTGFLNVGMLEPGHFCGDELLTWALDPNSAGNLPSSTRSVRAETDVEAFALSSEDLKFVASQFRRLHSKQVQHTFRHYSHQWQTWAACSIQAAWRRYKRRKLEELRWKEEESYMQTLVEGSSPAAPPNISLGTAIYASRFAANAMRAVHRLRDLRAAEGNLATLKLRKPAEPDFSQEEGD